MRNVKLGGFKRILMTILVFLLNVTYHANLSAAGYTCSNTQGTWCFRANSGEMDSQLQAVYCPNYTYICFASSMDVAYAQACYSSSCTGTGVGGKMMYDLSKGTCTRKDFCYCKAGYAGTASSTAISCSCCQSGYYTSGTGQSKCTIVAKGYYANSTSCATGATKCPTIATNTGTADATTASSGQTAVTACFIPSGQSLTESPGHTYNFTASCYYS